MEDNQLNQNLNEEKKRGGCLTAFLIVFLIFQGIGVVSNIIGLFTKDSEFMMQYYEMAQAAPPSTAMTVISIIIAIFMFVGLILVFQWKKMGVYLFTGGYIVQVITSIIVSPNVMTIVCAIVGLLIVQGIFLLLIKNVFKYMK